MFKYTTHSIKHLKLSVVEGMVNWGSRGLPGAGPWGAWTPARYPDRHVTVLVQRGGHLVRTRGSTGVATRWEVRKVHLIVVQDGNRPNFWKRTYLPHQNVWIVAVQAGYLFGMHLKNALLASCELHLTCELKIGQAVRVCAGKNITDFWENKLATASTLASSRLV